VPAFADPRVGMCRRRRRTTATAPLLMQYINDGEYAGFSISALVRATRPIIIV